MSRFTKAVVIEQIAARAKSHEKAGKFDVNNGTFQLLPPGAGPKMTALIDRAVEYGRMRALMSVAQDIESGHLGVSEKSSS